ncbi:serine/threonine-protein kinase [Allorhodopirellula solitaria]|uniref:Serine/threonine-protein kinase PrkC n=1 Tax=Allorhodopirellula solitaria TaxID=2527987 RepID=A0A5C5YG89_9BACT|nr:serine/threonine-protein kinase [Allorhodopirellula solitaria]TWT73989.1 Serine/threonine-protein kinase PrkC [Allorhodopirellula solitaria]
MNAAQPQHECFSIDALTNYQLGKLSYGAIAQIEREAYDCSKCRSQIASLDDVADETVRLLAGLDHSTLRSDASATPFRSSAQDSYQPQRFGNYDLIRPIGRGGMGEVWRATHRSLHRDVAVKLMPLDKLICDTSRMRFERESTHHGELIHDNLVHAYDAGEIDGIPYLAMELLDGCDAIDWCDPSRLLPFEAACEVARQAALGLAHAHSKGFIHRDIKPSNLRITSIGCVKILDMGLARLVQQQGVAEATTSKNQVLGTIAYMAPEQFRDPSSVTASADLYSLGCTLFHLLCGHPPHPNDDEEGLIATAVRRHNQAAPDVHSLRPEIPKTLSQLVGRLISQDPVKRVASAEDLVKELSVLSSHTKLLSTIQGNGSLQSQDIVPKRVARKTKWFLSVAAIAATVVGTAMLMSRSAHDSQGRGIHSQNASQLGVGDKDVAGLPEINESTRLAVLKLAVDEPIQNKLLVAINARPEQKSWIVSLGNGLISAVTLEDFPNDTTLVHLPGRTRMAKNRALDELVRSEASHELLAKIGLDDHRATTATIEMACREGTVAGQVHLKHLVAARDEESIIGVAIARRDKLHAAWISTPCLPKLHQYYRNAIVKRYQAAMESGSCQAALRDIEHLMSKPFVAAEDYLAAANCYDALGDTSEAVSTLDEALSLAPSLTSIDFLVAVGDRCLEIDTGASEKVAERAFTKALYRLQTNP